MAATLGATQRKYGLATLDVTLVNCGYQILWHQTMLNEKILSNHLHMLQSPTLVAWEKNDAKLDRK